MHRLRRVLQRASGAPPPGSLTFAAGASVTGTAEPATLGVMKVLYTILAIGMILAVLVIVFMMIVSAPPPVPST